MNEVWNATNKAPPKTTEPATNPAPTDPLLYSLLQQLIQQTKPAASAENTSLSASNNKPPNSASATEKIPPNDTFTNLNPQNKMNQGMDQSMFNSNQGIPTMFNSPGSYSPMAPGFQQAGGSPGFNSSLLRYHLLIHKQE
eukprot:gb/GEZN01022714.1/.p1 GENE.gb/GEZN01022714.1/~~gb/GEZN01022714.1/.p1  ORF type:complete len:140 (-),score=13.62 gb/GEZN01022714.1/:51-470(-)